MTSIPSGIKPLYDAAGPILRHRILRDVLGRDESYIETADLLAQVQKLPHVSEVLRALSSLRGDEFYRTYLRLCEYGLESSPALQQTKEQSVLPALGPLASQDQITRDCALHLLGRVKVQDALIESHLETLLAEWMKTGQATWMGFAAVCCYPWQDDAIPRVHENVKHLFEKLETQPSVNFIHDDLLTPSLLRIPSKEEYLARPARFFFDLELSARLGITNELDVTRWLFEELEARQDADGWVRFPPTEERNWYFPMEAKSAEDFHIEYTFRAAHIFKLLEYDF